MADYYSLLSRAVANLPQPPTPSARQAIYDRARKALNNQLRSLKPALPESDIAREGAFLEAAVMRLEGEIAPPGAEGPASWTPPPAPPPAQNFPKPHADVTPSVRPPAPTRPLAPTLGAAPPAVRPAPSPLRPQPPQRPQPPLRSAPPVAPPQAEESASQSPAADLAPKLGAADAPVGGVVATPPAVYAPFGEEVARVAAENGSAGASPPRAEMEPTRPSAPRAEEPSGGRAWMRATVAILVGLVGVVAVAAFLLRSQKAQDLALPLPSEMPAPVASDSGPKIANRAGANVEGVATATPAPQPAPLSPTPATEATPGASPSPTPGAAPGSPAPSPAASQPPPAPAEIQSAGARAAMLVALPQDVQKPAVSVGADVWSMLPPAPGQTGGPAVKAEVEIPDLKMRATMILRKNVDSMLPASHTIDLHFSFDDDSPIKAIKDVGVPQMRRDDPPEVTPLAGVRVMINETYFLIGLNRTDADEKHNLDAIAAGSWFDFPMLLADGRIAKLTFEKSADGDKIVNAALAAWK